MKMRYLMIFLAFLTLILSIGAISASQDINDTVSLDDTQSVDQSSADDIKSVDESNEVKASSSTSTTTNKTVTKTTVSTPDTSFLFKRNSKLKIKIKDKSTGKAVKNLKIAFKIKNGKKTKTYTLKTNSKGVATFSTKKLSLGYHKFKITSKNSNYKVSKKDYIFIGNLYKTTLNMGSTKKLKNGDAIYTFVQKKNGQFKKGVNTDLWYTGGKNSNNGEPSAHYTKLYKAKFFFKNKKTGKIITVKSKGELYTYKGELYRDLPHVDLIKGYKPIQTKIWYLISK